MNITNVVRELTKMEGSIVEVIITDAVEIGDVDDQTNKATIIGKLAYLQANQTWTVTTADGDATVQFQSVNVNHIETRNNRYTKICVVWS